MTAEQKRQVSYRMKRYWASRRTQRFSSKQPIQTVETVIQRLRDRLTVLEQAHQIMKEVA